MKTVIAVAVLLLSSLSASAQQHFVVSANAGSTTPGAVSVMSSGFQVTEYISLAYTRISNPSDGTKPLYNLGDLNVSRELATFLPKSVLPKLKFDATNYLVTFQASAGKVNIPAKAATPGCTSNFSCGASPAIDRIAAGAGIYLSRPVANNVQLTVGYRFLMPGNQVIKVPSAGLNFTF